MEINRPDPISEIITKFLSQLSDGRPQRRKTTCRNGLPSVLVTLISIASFPPSPTPRLLFHYSFQCISVVNSTDSWNTTSIVRNKFIPKPKSDTKTMTTAMMMALMMMSMGRMTV